MRKRSRSLSKTVSFSSNGGWPSEAIVNQFEPRKSSLICGSGSDLSSSQSARRQAVADRKWNQEPFIPKEFIRFSVSLILFLLLLFPMSTDIDQSFDTHTHQAHGMKQQQQKQKRHSFHVHDQKMRLLGAKVSIYAFSLTEIRFRKAQADDYSSSSSTSSTILRLLLLLNLMDNQIYLFPFSLSIFSMSPDEDRWALSQRINIQMKTI